MDKTHPSAGSAPCAAPQASSAAVTSMLARLQARYGELGVQDPMRGLLTYGSLKVVQLDSDPMVTQPHSPWALLPLSQALPAAILDTHTSGDHVILCFANTSWRLLIASKIVTMPSFGDGGCFGSMTRMSTRALRAKLYAQPQGQPDPNSTVLRAWHATVPAADDEATLLFLCTALLQSLPTIVVPSGEYLSELLQRDDDEYIPEPPEEDE